MFHKFLLAIILFTSLALFGQMVPNSIPPGPGLQGNSGYVSGIAGNGQIAASTVTFASPAPTAGISAAGFAGISDHAPIQQGVQSTLAPSTVVYTSAPPTISYGGSSAVNPAVSSEANSTDTSNNLGPSFYAGSNAASAMNAAAPPSSLAEMAVRYKAHAHNARLYTNADLQQLIGRNGSGSVMAATNRAPSGVLASAQNARQSTANAAQNTGNTTTTNSAQSDAQRANPGSAATQSNSTQPNPAAQTGNAGSKQSTTSSTATSDQAGQTSTARSAENSASGNTGTTPQARERQSGDAQAMNRLPATSTILPLLGLIGLASSGVGLWCKRRRR